MRKEFTASLYTNENVFKISYHYMHYLPNSICVMLVPRCLLERTKEALSKDPMILIDDIKEFKHVSLHKTED